MHSLFVAMQSRLMKQHAAAAHCPWSTQSQASSAPTCVVLSHIDAARHNAKPTLLGVIILVVVMFNSILIGLIQKVWRATEDESSQPSMQPSGSQHGPS
jgi:hypothetical protein